MVQNETLKNQLAITRTGLSTLTSQHQDTLEELDQFENTLNRSENLALIQEGKGFITPKNTDILRQSAAEYTRAQLHAYIVHLLKVNNRGTTGINFH